jgi:hypothetical protein
LNENFWIKKFWEAVSRYEMANCFINAVAREFDLTKADAKMMTAMASSSSIAAASYVRAADREQSIEKVLRFIFAGFESARR